MRHIGFSTGALALGDWQKALAMLNKSAATAIELSALREQELEPLIKSLPEIDLSKFNSVFFHAPSKLEKLTERELVEMLKTVTMKEWPIIVHPDIIQNYNLWSDFGELLCIENMDRRKSKGRTAEELLSIFEKLPSASFCFDIGHARHIDRTMSQAKAMIHEFHARMKVIHLSEVDIHGHHVPLSFMAMLSFSHLSKMIADKWPIIFESPVYNAHIDAEINCAVEFLTTPGKTLLQTG
ncbi:MAG: hypothetical protein WBC22_04700 [Sedimentisphaerales bacterium]